METKSINDTPGAVKRPAAQPNLATWLFPGYLLTIFGGYLLLQAPGAMSGGQEMGQVRALFSAVNAGTLTGFGQTINIDSYQPLGQATIFTLMVCGSLFSLMIGAGAVTRILRLGFSDGRILAGAVSAEIAAIVAGTIMLMFDSDRTMGQAVFLAASAFGNCGLYLGHAPLAGAWQTHVALLPLMAAGGVGLCVLMELFEIARGRRGRLSEHGRTTLIVTGWFYIGGTVLLTLLGLERGEPLQHLVAVSAAAAVGSRTAGMGLVAMDQLTRPAFWIVLVLMGAGACSGGTGGGIKVNTLAEIFRGVRRALLGKAPGRGFGIAAVWVGGYVLLALVSLLLLLYEVPQESLERLLVDAVSAASNVGLTYEPLSPDRGAVFILSGTMLLGRFVPMIVLWWAAETTERAELAVG